MTTELRYWDSNCFLGWLNGEPDKVKACEGVVKAAEEGKVMIVTSAWTIAEVVYLKGETPIPVSKATEVESFFDNRFIRVRHVDRDMAERARKLVWEHPGLKPKDAMHLATAAAEELEIKIFDTFDQDLFKLDGQVGNPPLRIGPPRFEFQPHMFKTVGRRIAIRRSGYQEILFRKFKKFS